MSFITNLLGGFGRTPGIVPEEEPQIPQEDPSTLNKVLDFIFGGEVNPVFEEQFGLPPQLQAVVPGAKSAAAKAADFARKAAPAIKQGVKAGGKKVGEAAKAVKNNVGKLGLGTAAAVGAGFVPGAKETAATGVTALRGLFSSDRDDEGTEVTAQAAPGVPGLPSFRQEVVDEVSTRSGLNLVSGSPSEDEARRLAGFENRRQAQQDVALRQAEGINRIQQIEQGLSGERQNLAEQIAGLRSQAASGGQDSTSQQLGFLLGAALPAALTGNVRGLGEAIQGSNQIGQSVRAQQAATQKQIQGLQARADKLLGQELSAVKAVIDSEGKLGSQLSKEAAAFKENIAQTRKAEDEGRLDPTKRINVGSSRWDSLGVSVGDKGLYRQAGAPKLSTENQKRLGNIVNTSPIIEHNLRTLQGIISQVGVTADAALSEPVTIIDPSTGEEKTYDNAAAAMETLSTLFKANVKDIESLGALGQDVLEFTGSLMDDPVGYLNSIKDTATSGGQTEKIVQQADVLIDNYRRQKDTFLKANQIQTITDINQEKLDLGEFQGFSRLPEGQTVPGHETRTIKMVDPEDGRVFLLSPEEFDAILKDARRAKQRR